MATQKANIFIVFGPSGAGKGTIIEGLKKYVPVERVITTSTRPMRPGNSQGNPYYFVSREEFVARRDRGEFLEWAEHYNGNLYGVTAAEIERVQNLGKVGVWELEWQGVLAIKKIYPEIPAIFIGAPLEVLEKRIRRRDSATEAYVAERMAYTKKWLEFANIGDYVVMNEEDKLAEAVEQVLAIVKKHGELS